MKKLLFLVLATFILMACEGPMGPAGQDGRDGKNGENGEGVNWYSMAITVNKEDWELKGNPGELNSYFFAYKAVNKLTEFVYKYGTVIAYIETEKGVKNGMPYVLHLGAESNDKEFLWTQTYDFDFDIGGVGFYVTYSDFNTQIRPNTEIFHVVLMW